MLRGGLVGADHVRLWTIVDKSLIESVTFMDFLNKVVFFNFQCILGRLSSPGLLRAKTWSLDSQLDVFVACSISSHRGRPRVILDEALKVLLPRH